MNIFSWLKEKIFGKKKKFSCALPLKYNEESMVLELDLNKLSANFISEDISNENGKFHINKEYIDEKTEFYEFVTNIEFKEEDDVKFMIKTVRRISFFRNGTGRLINVLVGQPQQIKKKFYS